MSDAWSFLLSVVVVKERLTTVLWASGEKQPKGPGPPFVCETLGHIIVAKELWITLLLIEGTTIAGSYFPQAYIAINVANLILALPDTE